VKEKLALYLGTGWSFSCLKGIVVYKFEPYDVLGSKRFVMQKIPAMTSVLAGVGA
jgi:hypothetical protein